MTKACRGDESNENALPEVLALYATDPDLRVRGRVARNPGAPDALLIALAVDDEIDVWAGLVENPSTPPEALDLLVCRESAWRRQRVLLGRNDAESIALDNDAEQWRQAMLSIARHHNVSSTTMRRLAEYPDQSLSEIVAQHPHTLRDERARLVRHESHDAPEVAPPDEEVSPRWRTRVAKWVKSGATASGSDLG